MIFEDVMLWMYLVWRVCTHRDINIDIDIDILYSLSIICPFVAQPASQPDSSNEFKTLLP